MEWHHLAESLVGSGPLAIALGLAVRTLWAKTQQLEKRVEELQEQRVADLREMLRSVDSSSN